MAAQIAQLENNRAGLPGLLQIFGRGSVVFQQFGQSFSSRAFSVVPTGDGKEPKMLWFEFGLRSSSTELETCFRGGHLLRINCKYQIID